MAGHLSSAATVRGTWIRLQQLWFQGGLQWASWALCALLCTGVAALAGLRYHNDSLTLSELERQRGEFWLAGTSPPSSTLSTGGFAQALPVQSANDVLASFHLALQSEPVRVGHVAIKEETVEPGSVRRLRVDARIVGSYVDSKAALGHFLQGHANSLPERITWSMTSPDTLELSVILRVLVRPAVPSSLSTDAK